MKKVIIGMFFILITILYSVGTVYAADCPQCDAGYHGRCGTGRIFVSRGASGHDEKCCCGASTLYANMKHIVRYYSKIDSTYHGSVCRCGYVMDSKIPHNISYVPISITQCRGNCKQCEYTFTQDHNFVDDVCTYCGLEVDEIIEIDDEGNKYLAVKNDNDSPKTVSIVMKGVVKSELGEGRTLTFTDEVPANTVRVYINYRMSASIGEVMFLGYYDLEGETAGNNGTLAIINAWLNYSI